MGSTYSVRSKMKFKDIDKAIEILQNKINRAEKENINYGLDTYRKAEELDLSDIDDLIAVFIGPGNMFDVDNYDDGWVVYHNGFNASYGWESVMMEMFMELAPVLEDTSDLFIYCDDGVDLLVIRNGECIQYM